MILEATGYVGEALLAAGIAHTGLSIYPPGSPPPESGFLVQHPDGSNVIVYGLDPSQEVQAESLIVSLVLAPHRTKTLWEIYSDLGGLSGPKLISIWNDLMSGTPRKLTLDDGPNAGTLAVLDWVAGLTSLTAQEATEGKRRAISCYVQDNPWYLVKPAFDPTINVSGYKPV